MALIDRIKSKARDELADISEADLREKTRDAFDKAKEQIAEKKAKLAEEVAVTPKQKLAKEEKESLLAMAEWGVARFEKHEDKLAKGGAWGLTAVASELAMGDEHEAAMVYLSTQAGWDELFDAVDDAQAADAQAKRDREAAKDAALEMMKDIGAGAAKAALPFLLKVVGL